MRASIFYEHLGLKRYRIKTKNRYNVNITYKPKTLHFKVTQIKQKQKNLIFLAALPSLPFPSLVLALRSGGAGAAGGAAGVEAGAETGAGAAAGVDTGDVVGPVSAPPSFPETTMLSTTAATLAAARAALAVAQPFRSTEHNKLLFSLTQKYKVLRNIKVLCL